MVGDRGLKRWGEVKVAAEAKLMISISAWSSLECAAKDCAFFILEDSDRQDYVGERGRRLMARDPDAACSSFLSERFYATPSPIFIA